MARRRQSGEDVLKDIIAKSTNEAYVSTAQSELAALKERKAAVAAAIKPVLEVPKIVADPDVEQNIINRPSVKTVNKEDDAINNIKVIRKDINALAEEAKKSRSILESILKTNSKYYESNQELLDRLLMAQNAMLERMGNIGNLGSTFGASSAQGVGGVTPSQQQPPPDGGPPLGLLGLAGYGAIKALKGVKDFVTRPFKKTPKVPDSKTKIPTDSPDVDANKKLLDEAKKGGGRLKPLIYGFTALGFSAPWILSFLGADDETQAKMIDTALGYVPDWLEKFVTEKPDLAFMLGVQVPDLAMNAARAAGTIATVGGGTLKAIKGYADALIPLPDVEVKPGMAPKVDATPKARIFPQNAAGTEFKGINERAAGIWAGSKTGTVGPVASTATSAVEETAKVASQSKTGIVKKVGKVTKETIGAAISKAIDDDVARIAGKKVPLLNIGLGTAFAGLRAWDGDYEGAKLEFMSGLVANLPLLGTAASVTADAYLIARDVYKSLYGVLPDQEKDPVLRDQRWNELITITQDLISEQAQKLAKQVSENTALNKLFGGTGSDASFNAMGDFGSPIGIEPDITIAAPPATSATPIGRGQYLQNNKPIPVPRINQQKLNNIETPPAQQGGNVIINKQGDTVNNITQGSAGSGTPSAVGSPSKVPSPFDTILYGDTFNWGY